MVKKNVKDNSKRVLYLVIDLNSVALLLQFNLLTCYLGRRGSSFFIQNNFYLRDNDIHG